MRNPVLVEVTRGGAVESRHRGAYAVIGPGGALISSAGGIDRPVFPRSAIKAIQCLPLIESGAADKFGFNDEEIALACASHNGEPDHVRVARSMLAKAGMNEAHYECGAHWPSDEVARHRLVRDGETAGQVHNNCSGKHAGMLALARMLGAQTPGYGDAGHEVQRAVAKTLDELCDVETAKLPMGIDGCSIPTWAIPLRDLARAFARLASGHGLTGVRKAAAGRVFAACRAHPFMIAGTGMFDTGLMTAVPRAFVKYGAEGVFCAAVPHAGIGIALKCDDGAARAVEAAIARVLAGLDVWTAEERGALESFTVRKLENRRGLVVGEVRAVKAQ